MAETAPHARCHLRTWAAEAAGTALMVLAILLAAFVSDERRARWTPLAIVPLLTAIIWLGSPWTGASLNPARSEGPALAFGELHDLWIYLVAPPAGALAAALSWRFAGLRACNAWPALRTNP